MEPAHRGTVSGLRALHPLRESFDMQYELLIVKALARAPYANQTRRTQVIGPLGSL